MRGQSWCRFGNNGWGLAISGGMAAAAENWAFGGGQCH